VSGFEAGICMRESVPENLVQMRSCGDLTFPPQTRNFIIFILNPSLESET